jgi:DNA-directed RNA polymerase subunit omega
MMLYPPVAELVDKIGSRYQLVNLVARRARKISSDAEEKQLPLDRKAVSIAIDEVYTGKLSIDKPDTDES